jgi:hypothetical protein
MSTHAVELALWTIVADPRDGQRFQADPEAFLAPFRLDDDERTIVRDLDVRRLIDRDLNSMLVMNAYCTVHGFQNIPAYLRTLNGDARG